MSKEEILNEIFLHKKSLCNQKHFSKKFPQEYEDLLSWEFPNDFTFSQKLYHYLHNDKYLLLGHCKKCHKRCKYTSIIDGYRTFCCIECSNKDESLKKKRSESYKEYYKNEDDCAKKDRYERQSKSLKMTNLRKPQYIKDEEYKKRGIAISNAYKSKPEEEKKKEIEKRSKTRSENWKLYPEEKKQMIIEKRKNAQLKKFNGHWAAQTPEFAKNRRKGILYDNIMFDSKWEIDLYILCKQLNLNFEYHPNITFGYTYDGAIHYYQPDFIIDGKLYEVKGGQFFKNDKMICPFDRNDYKDGLFEAKHQCMINNNVTILLADKTRMQFKNLINSIFKND